MASTESRLARLAIVALAWILGLTSTAQAILERTYRLELRLRCDTRELFVGDEIPIVFTLTNRDDAVCTTEFREHDRSGRVPEHKLIATNSDGRQVVDPRDGVDAFWFGGGLSPGPRSLTPGQSCSRTIALNRWARITKPGRYSVAGVYHYTARDETARRFPGGVPTRGVKVISEPIEIEVRRRSSAEMGHYIRSLVAQLHSLQGQQTRQAREERVRLIARLAYTCDTRIVPTVIEHLYEKPHNNETFEIVHAFLCYLPRNVETREAVVRAARAGGLVEGIDSILEHFGCGEAIFKEIISLSLASEDPAVVSMAALTAQQHPADEHMPTLVAIATYADYGKNRRLSSLARTRAIHALGHHRTDEGVAALKSLLESPERDIRRTARGTIRHGCKRRRIYPQQVDEGYTATLAAIATDAGHPHRFRAVLPILDTRTKAGAAALKILVKDPNAHVPIVETDLGVRTIRDLLRHSDANVRDLTASYVRSVYREWPGRLFRIDDFPDEFQIDWEERKKTVLERLRLTD